MRSYLSLIGLLLFQAFTLQAQQACDSLDAYDTPLWQLQSLGIDDLHANGFTGKGIKVAVFDNGFLNVDSLPGFESTEIVYQKDLVEGDYDVIGPCEGRCTHGSRVLSVLAARGPDGLKGSAPDASYLLFRTEDDFGESKFEENYWAEAARLADSLGAHIIVSAVGYLDFDDGSMYSKEQLDGRTSITSRAAIQAARNGILVINAAGNEGRTSLLTPADADSILAVGALSPDGDITAFSSRGPSADGRIKPEVVAQGQSVFQISPDGELTRGNGTSYATPLIGGLAACLWQAAHESGQPVDAQAIRQAIINSADRSDSPNNDVGYGMPFGPKAFTLITNQQLEVKGLCKESFIYENAFVYPNPSAGQAFFAFRVMEAASSGRVIVLDKSGKQLWQTNLIIHPGLTQTVRLPSEFQNGHYIISLIDDTGARRASAVWVKRD